MEEVRAQINVVKVWIIQLWASIKQIRTSKSLLLLIFILIFGAIVNLIPHFGYTLPLHTDEWHYMAYSNALIDSGDVVINHPYTGEANVHLWEIGYLVLLSLFKINSGISWPFLFTTLPTVIFLFVILTAYALGKRFGYGHHAAFIVSLIPSTVRFLGPGFLVPISLGIFLVLLSLLLILRYESKFRYLPLILIISFTFLMHPATGIYLYLILLSILIIFGLGKKRVDLYILGVTLLSFFILGLFLPQSSFYNVNLSRITIGGRFFLPTFGFSDFIELMGYLPIILMAIGVGVLLRRKKTEGLGLTFSVSVLALFLMIIFYVFPNFFNVQAIFDRAIILLTVLISVVAGCGLYYVQKAKKTVFAITMVCMLLILVPAHADEPYYHIISESEYDDFIWIRNNVHEPYDKAILDPWKAVAFPPVTGKEVYFSVPQGPSSSVGTMTSNVNRFFAEGCTDTDFLLANGIDIVYTQTQCLNPDLIEVRDGIYILDYSLVSWASV
ncbi:MAG: hypothetical protein AYK23_00975 [Candidatus Proteinoplasmatales archaeon SG8-5]|nr:MAG: hypothetical protein AYK23_00975 [Candidatus Proteinoplasmatales archaeon SG8-5]